MTLLKESVGNATIPDSETIQGSLVKLPAQSSFYSNEHPDIFYFNQECTFENPQIPKPDYNRPKYISSEPKHLLGYQHCFIIASDKSGFIINQPKRMPNLHDFGPGKAGKNAFRAFIFGDGCEGPSDNENWKCGKEPKFTVDFDILGGEEYILVCGEECQLNVRNKVQEGLVLSDRSTTMPGINGNGRT